jgi:hypothetical protein
MDALCAIDRSDLGRLGGADEVLLDERTDNSPANHPAVTRPAFDDSGCKTNPPQSQFKRTSH